MKTGSIIVLTLLASFYAFTQPSPELTANITGSWTLPVPSVDVTEAGNNYGGTYTSAPNQVLIGFQGNPPGQFKNISWSIEIYRLDATWDPSIQLWVRRTGNGNGQATGQCTPAIYGGLTYQQVTNVTSPFLSGACQYSNIPLEFQVRNVSVLTPAQNYSTQVVYTVTITGL